MWPFRRKPKPAKHIKRVVVGFVIGAAISSIVGKKLLDKEGRPIDEDEGEERD